MDQMKIDSPWKLTTVQGSGPFPTQEIDVSGIKRKWLDVAYADQSPAQKLDIFLPDVFLQGPGSQGLVLVVFPGRGRAPAHDAI